MVKLSALPLLFIGLPFLAGERINYRDYLNVADNERGNNTLMSVSYTSDNEFRLYHYDDLVIDEVGDEAFKDTNFKTLVLTKDVKYINDAAFTNAPNIEYLRFTGSKAEYNNLNLNVNFEEISFYSVDEGFINYWNENIRPTANTNICDYTTSQTFGEVYALYKNLSESDLEIVNNYEDLSGAKISASMKELIRVFATPDKAQKNDEWNQTGAITLIIFIAVLGMTFITVFFLLKTKHIIE